jgi:hypothetical protein
VKERLLARRYVFLGMMFWYLLVAATVLSADQEVPAGGKAELRVARSFCGATLSFQADPSVEQFWSRFKSAVQKSDKTAVAAMTQFPIEMPYGVPRIRNRSQLTTRWRDLFSVQAQAAKCFEDAKPVVDSANRNRFTVGCKDVAGNEVVVYGFLKTRAGWKLTYLDNINE